MGFISVWVEELINQYVYASQLCKVRGHFENIVGIYIKVPLLLMHEAMITYAALSNQSS